jgi:hypothetical protein
VHPRLVAASVALVLTSACTGMEQLPPTADATDRERAAFCHTLGRAISAAEDDGGGTTAREAAEELLARAPEELAAPARALVDHLEEAAAGDSLATDAVHDALDALRDGAARTCRTDGEADR